MCWYCYKILKYNKFISILLLFYWLFIIIYVRLSIFLSKWIEIVNHLFISLLKFKVFNSISWEYNIWNNKAIYGNLSNYLLNFIFHQIFCTNQYIKSESLVHYILFTNYTKNSNTFVISLQLSYLLTNLSIKVKVRCFDWFIKTFSFQFLYIVFFRLINKRIIRK